MELGRPGETSTERQDDQHGQHALSESRPEIGLIGDVEFNPPISGRIADAEVCGVLMCGTMRRDYS